MPTGDPPDPVRATLVAILQQLNRAESLYEGQKRDQSLGLADIERMLGKFWAIDQDLVKVPLVLGLLVRNGMVEVQAAGNYVPPKTGPKTPPKPQYRITAGGKQFLVESLEKSDRIA
jgi:hypothetical protein